jgi:hypothetical protein
MLKHKQGKLIVEYVTLMAIIKDKSKKDRFPEENTEYYLEELIKILIKHPSYLHIFLLIDFPFYEGLLRPLEKYPELFKKYYKEIIDLLRYEIELPDKEGDVTYRSLANLIKTTGVPYVPKNTLIDVYLFKYLHEYYKQRIEEANNINDSEEIVL